MVLGICPVGEKKVYDGKFFWKIRVLSSEWKTVGLLVSDDESGDRTMMNCHVWYEVKVKETVSGDVKLYNLTILYFFRRRQSNSTLLAVLPIAEFRFFQTLFKLAHICQFL